jgi:hypothetical protein
MVYCKQIKLKGTSKINIGLQHLGQTLEVRGTWKQQCTGKRKHKSTFLYCIIRNETMLGIVIEYITHTVFEKKSNLGS